MDDNSSPITALSPSDGRTYMRVINGVAIESLLLPMTPHEYFSAHPEMAAEWVDITGVSPAPQPHWLYKNNAWSAPQASTPPAQKIFSKMDFLKRFSTEERQAVLKASQEDMDIYEVLTVSLANNIDITAPETKAALDVLVGKGLLTSDREVAILTP